MKEAFSKIQNITLFEEKKRFLLFVLLLFSMLFLSYYLLTVAYSRYEVQTKIFSNIDKAVYIFKGEDVSFSLDPAGIVPSSTAYSYRFSVSNFDGETMGDVDLSYTVSVRTTTNLPISVALYRNELPEASGATNILSAARNAQDEDGAWYRVYDVNDEYEMLFEDQVTDVYTMVITFPAVYSNDPIYSNYLENIEVSLHSEQMIA